MGVALVALRCRFRQRDRPVVLARPLAWALALALVALHTATAALGRGDRGIDRAGIVEDQRRGAVRVGGWGGRGVGEQATILEAIDDGSEPCRRRTGASAL
jgi:hypothetical protein